MRNGIRPKLSRTNYDEGMTEVVNIHDAKTHLSRLLERVASGETITIAKAGHPVADLVPHVAKPVQFGVWAGELDFDDDVFVGTDADVQKMFYGDDAAS
jgi:prevent-host-death family protein